MHFILHNTAPSLCISLLSTFLILYNTRLFLLRLKLRYQVVNTDVSHECFLFGNIFLQCASPRKSPSLVSRHPYVHVRYANFAFVGHKRAVKCSRRNNGLFYLLLTSIVVTMRVLFCRISTICFWLSP